MKNHLLLSLMLVTLSTCTKTLDFDDEGFANQVVVNGIIWPDQNFSVYLIQSGSILIDRQTNPPLEGTLELYEDEILIRQFPSQLGHFTAPDIQTKAGKNYRIVVFASGRQLNAETTIPMPAEVLSMDTTTFKNEYGAKTTSYKIKVKDPRGEDFYRIVIMHESLFMVSSEDTRKYYKYTTQDGIESDDPVFKSVYNNFGDKVIDIGPNNDYFIFPDIYFQGKEQTIQFQSAFWFNWNPLPGGYGDPTNQVMAGKKQPVYDRQTIHVQRLSKDLYNYMKYLKLYNHFHDNPFSEPLPVYSNVKNGAGIFAGFNDDSRFTFENIYIPFSMDTIQIETIPSY